MNATFYNLKEQKLYEEILISWNIYRVSSSWSECSTQGQVLHCKRMNLGCSYTEGKSSTANAGTKVAILPGIEFGAVASRCFPHPLFL